jgi:hypothetical protein
MHHHPRWKARVQQGRGARQVDLGTPSPRAPGTDLPVLGLQQRRLSACCRSRRKPGQPGLPATQRIRREADTRPCLARASSLGLEADRTRAAGGRRGWGLEGHADGRRLHRRRTRRRWASEHLVSVPGWPRSWSGQPERAQRAALLRAGRGTYGTGTAICAIAVSICPYPVREGGERGDAGASRWQPSLHPPEPAGQGPDGHADGRRLHRKGSRGRWASEHLVSVPGCPRSWSGQPQRAQRAALLGPGRGELSPI